MLAYNFYDIEIIKNKAPSFCFCIISLHLIYYLSIYLSVIYVHGTTKLTKRGYEFEGRQGRMVYGRVWKE